jgi:CMP-N,N'-diacetyllegionaminic acid synthase
LLAIIPARGGSIGIPKKNLTQLGDVPLIAYSITSALQSSMIDRVVVSTDSDEIAEIAILWGAEVINRPANISGPESTTEATLLHVLDTLAFAEYIPSHSILLQPTSPFRIPGSIDEAFSNLIDHNFDSLLSVEPSHLSLWENGPSTAKANYDFEDRAMRQEVMDRQFRENGSIYAFSTELLRDKNNRLGGRIGLHISTGIESLEIDTMFDLWMCRKVLEDNLWEHALPALDKGVEK